MIVVDAQLIPFGDYDLPSTYLCRLHIVNDGTGSRTRGNYNLTLFSKGVSPRVIKRGRIEDWPRNSRPAWRLIAKAFETLDLS